MKFIKLGVLFLVAFVVAWVAIFTFLQPPFHARVPAIILWRQTAPYPIYLYLVVSLLVGLAIGAVMTLYYYITFAATAHARSRELDDLAQQNAQLRSELERAQHECADLRERSTLRKTDRMPSTPPPRRPEPAAPPVAPQAAPPAAAPRPAAPRPQPPSPPKNVDRL